MDSNTKFHQLKQIVQDFGYCWITVLYCRAEERNSVKIKNGKIELEFSDPDCDNEKFDSFDELEKYLDYEYQIFGLDLASWSYHKGEPEWFAISQYTYDEYRNDKHPYCFSSSKRNNYPIPGGFRLGEKVGECPRSKSYTYLFFREKDGKFWVRVATMEEYQKTGLN